MLGFAAIRNSLIAGFATVDEAGKLRVDKESVRVISGPAHAVTITALDPRANNLPRCAPLGLWTRCAPEAVQSVLAETCL